ncbi:putative hydrolase [Candidatus Protochlamydia naegleriophila]|uniref:Putative hydrolase n=1 Tax=Candidatus Protochlamydia naegleriophila TaxID=389348 RepID=A0A0U5JFJ7_9BACT|nr:alpha/beta hydrolase [Candidatus Protochlamydia naegleriophila]CUI17167.1 putative hydrolase [Candidatus Protochlamydia naegleriophila]
MPKLETMLPLHFGWINLVLDIPDGEIKALVVFCHGLTGDRSGPQRILTAWGKTLAEQHYLVARFDFRGSGDSSGAFEKTTFAQMEEDLEAVIDWCRAHYSFPHIILAGLSLGGVVASNALKKYKECKAICLFNSDVRNAPPFDLCCDPLPIREGQFFLHKQFFEERLSLFPEQTLAHSNAHRFLFYGDGDMKIRQLVETLEPIGVRTIKIKNSGHLFESLQARSLAINKMVEALELLSER